jgi:RNA polymerase sporulation-specific sigma factor
MSAYSTAPSPADVAHLAQQHYPLVVYIAKRFMRSSVPLDDLIGEGSVGLVRGLQSYDPTRGPLGPHLGACIKQSIIAGLRRWKPWQPLPSDAEGDDLAIEDCFGQDPAEDAEFEDDKAMVRRLLRVLHPEDRGVVEFHYLGGKTISEIAQAAGLSRGRIRQRLARALARMRRHATPVKRKESKSLQTRRQAEQSLSRDRCGPTDRPAR